MSITTAIQEIAEDRDVERQAQNECAKNSALWHSHKRKADAHHSALAKIAEAVRGLRMQNVKIGCSEANALLPTNEQLDEALKEKP